MHLIVSGGNRLCEFDENLSYLRSAALEQAGALCAMGQSLYCACENVIWRMNAATLMPSALFAGGPGMRTLLASPGRRRIYALCADADSLLSLDSVTGAPLYLNRAGVNPMSAMIEESGGVIAVAGGESAETVLLSADTLDVLRRLPMPGIVFSAAAHEGVVYSLSLSERLTSLFTVSSSSGSMTKELEGMPGSLLLRGSSVTALTHGKWYEFDANGSLLACGTARGRAACALVFSGKMLFCDVYAQTLRVCEGQKWREVCSCAHSAAVVCE